MEGLRRRDARKFRLRRVIVVCSEESGNGRRRVERRRRRRRVGADLEPGRVIAVRLAEEVNV
jgi:hypothetical protein